MVNSNKIQDALKQCLGEFALYDYKSPFTILIPKIGTHAIIYGALYTSDYMKIMTHSNTKHYNLMEGDSLQILEAKQSYIVVTDYINDVTMFTAYIPYQDIRIYPLSEFVKSAPNIREIEQVLDLSLLEEKRVGNINQVFIVRPLCEDSYAELFFETVINSNFNYENFRPNDTYDDIIEDYYAGMYGYVFYKEESA